jgi:uncharacterized protein (TIGR00369 family)
MSTHASNLAPRARTDVVPGEAAPFLTMAQKMIRGELPPPPVAQTVGFSVSRIERGRAVIEFDAEPRHWNPMGGLHGGILCDIADAAMGMSYATTLAEGETFTTVELKINFMRPFKTGRLVAEGYIVNGGRTLGVVDCDIRDGAGRLIARASSTCMTLRSPNGKES